MRSFRLLLSILASMVLMSAARAASPVSFFPEKDLGKFLADKFDLATVRSSLGPRRSLGLRSFADFGMKPSKATETILVFDTPGGWFYELKILGRGDVNKDGIEDLQICFTDRAQNGGTYHTSKGLLVTRYADDAYAVALSFGLDHEACEEFAR